MKRNPELLHFLRNIGNDENPDGSPAWVECDDTGPIEEAKDCKGDCGKCRYDYMKKKGWLK